MDRTLRSWRGKASVKSDNMIRSQRFKCGPGRTTRTLAPNARGGRLVRNFDLTTPEPPCGLVTRLNFPLENSPNPFNRDSPPNDPNLRAVDFTLSLINKGNALTLRQSLICADK